MGIDNNIRLTSDPLKIGCLFEYLDRLPLENSSAAAVEEVLDMIWHELDEAIEKRGPNPIAIVNHLIEHFEHETDEILVRDWDRQAVADVVETGMTEYLKTAGLDRLAADVKESLLSEVRYQVERLALDGEIGDLNDAVERATREAYSTLDEVDPDLMRQVREAIPA